MEIILLTSATIVLFILLIIGIPYLRKTLPLKKIKASDLPSEGSWIKVKRGNVYYRWYKSETTARPREVMVMVHGFSTPSFVWKGLIKKLTSHGIDLLVYDHFGRGWSERPFTNYDKGLYVETLKELIESQDIDSPVHLVGYSMGGPIIGHFANDNPKMVKSTTFLAPAGFRITASGINSWSTYPLIGEWFWHVFSDKIYGVGRMSETSYSDDPLSINEEEFLYNFNKQLAFKGFTESLLSTVRNFNLFDVREMYTSLGEKNIPSLAIWGTKDGVVPYDGSNQLIKCIPHCKLVTIEGGTHDITYRQPTDVGDALINFLIKIED